MFVQTYHCRVISGKYVIIYEVVITYAITIEYNEDSFHSCYCLQMIIGDLYTSLFDFLCIIYSRHTRCAQHIQFVICLYIILYSNMFSFPQELKCCLMKEGY